MFDEKKYKKRLIDDKINTYLEVFGALIIEGPKWVGKTFTSYMHTKSQVTLSEESFRNLAKSNPKYIFTEDKPQLIDEWQLVPEVWDSVRNECDARGESGNFILTGSTSLSKTDRSKIFHSGAGRFERMRMYPMSLFESNISNGRVSISDLQNGKDIKEGIMLDTPDLRELAKICIKGGWPQNVNEENEDRLRLLPDSYIKAICNDDYNKDENYSPRKLKQILISLARNESTLATKKTIISDISDDEDIHKRSMISSRTSLDKYLGYLDRIYVTDDVEAYSTNYKSVSRVGKNSKKHLVDPSLVCSLLNLTVDKLMLNHKVYGCVFESLVLRDLRIYMDYLNGSLYHFRDNLSGDEVDAILEFDDGEYACCEIKLTKEYIDAAKKSLMKYYKNAVKKPKFMCIICGDINYAIKDKETNIYILPITCLKP